MTPSSEHSLAVARTGAVLAWGTWVGVLVAVLLPTHGEPHGAAHRGARGTRSSPTGPRSPTTRAPPTRSRSPAPRWPSWPRSRRSPARCSSTGRPTATRCGLPLRVPTTLVLGPVPLAWVAAVAGPIAGPLLLAAGAVGRRGRGARRRLAARGRCRARPPRAGAALGRARARGARAARPARARGTRAVPATIDPTARAGSGRRRHRHALDLTQRALGLALELELADPTLGGAAPRRPDPAGRGRRSDSSSPRSRPGALLARAAERRIPVG